MDVPGGPLYGGTDRVEVEGVVAVAAVGRAPPHPDQARSPQLGQVVGDQVRRLAGGGDHLAHPQVAIGEQTDDRPAQVVGDDAQ